MSPTARAHFGTTVPLGRRISRLRIAGAAPTPAQLVRPRDVRVGCPYRKLNPVGEQSRIG
jgi:hypothetical protein